MGNNSNNDLDKIEEEVRQKELEELLEPHHLFQKYPIQ